MTVSGAVNVIDPKELWVIVLVLIQTVRLVEQENMVKRLLTGTVLPKSGHFRISGMTEQ